MKNLNKKLINTVKITHHPLLIAIKSDGLPKLKSRGGLQNRCVSWVGFEMWNIREFK